MVKKLTQALEKISPLGFTGSQHFLAAWQHWQVPKDAFASIQTSYVYLEKMLK